MKICLFILISLITSFAWAQDSTRAKTGLGEGLRFDLDSGRYQFKISGFLQPSYTYTKAKNRKAESTFRSKRTYLNVSGSAVEERVSFLVQVDFSAATPLLDAWAAYRLHPNFALSVGQRRTFTNNREMTFDEDKLQFTERGMLSTAFTGNGREFGLFLEGRLGNSFIVLPQFALTSGDGPNSFGINASDVDLGGLKYGGRIDIYPFGEFSVGNRGFAPDLHHEAKPKVLLGASGSFNQGASNAKGEGHGDFIFYDSARNQNLPDLRKLSADLLVKYQGFSLLAELVNASASGLAGIYTDTASGSAGILRPSEISQYLVLGNAYNVQVGYVTRSGYSLDLRYENLLPEFSKERASSLQKANIRTIGLSRYFNDHRLKAQVSVSSVNYTNGRNTILGELMFQVVL
jgi:hypothetical protein